MYKCLQENQFYFDNYSIVALRQEDIFLIKEWRNAQMDVLRQSEVLSDQDQQRYYNTAVLPCFEERHPRQILFSLLEKDVCIGYGGLTNIDWMAKRTEMSFLVNPKRTLSEDTYTADFSAFISLLKKVMFTDLGFNRIFTETYDIRPLHIRILEKNGFVLEGRLKQHVHINNTFVDSLIHGYIKSYFDAER
jgi:RimJ/RimL family protein N-acetyltransferase